MMIYSPRDILAMYADGLIDYKEARELLGLEQPETGDTSGEIDGGAAEEAA